MPLPLDTMAVVQQWIGVMMRVRKAAVEAGAKAVVREAWGCQRRVSTLAACSLVLSR
jgi:hypothetical protein